jgi:hypothetical protein
VRNAQCSSYYTTWILRLLFFIDLLALGDELKKKGEEIARIGLEQETLG